MNDLVLPPRVLILGLAALANLGLGTLVYWRYRAFRLLRVFAYNALSLSAYCIFVAGLSVIRTAEAAQAWVRALIFVPHLAVLSFAYFCAILARAEGRTVRIALWVGGALFLSEIIARASGFAPVMLHLEPGQGWLPTADPFYSWVYLPTFFTFLIGSWVIVAWRWKKSDDPLERQQLATFFVAVSSLFLVSCLDAIPATEPYASLAPLVYLVIVAYGITRRSLFDIDLLLRKGAVLAALSTVVTVVFGLAILLGRHAWENPGSSNLFASILTIVVLVLAYDAIKGWTAKSLNRFLGEPAWEPQEKLVEYALLIAETPRLDDFLQNTCKRLSGDLGLTRASIWVRDRSSALVSAAAFPIDGEQTGPELAADDARLDALRARPRGLDLDSLAWTHAYDGPNGKGPSPQEIALRDLLRAWGFHAAFPLLDGDQLTGILLVGPLASGGPLRDADTGFLSALTVQLATAVQNSLLHRQVQQADRLSTLGTISASLAHEIRNPLTAISTFVQMLGSRHNDPAFLEKFDRIVTQELSKLTRLTEQLLTFARPAASRRSETSMNQLSERVHQLLHSQFSRKGVQFSLQLAPEDLWVRANEAELSQVLINLAINALHATPEGGQVALHTALQGATVRMRVVDNGSGMSPAQQKRLFEPFFSTKEGGTGLGLTTCQRIVEEHGGKIEVESIQGQGSSFNLTLPMAGAPAMEANT
jgi:signal transduction histidine kinase